MIPGILASGVALQVISAVREPSFRRLLSGAVLMGAGIGAMHYSGMAAIRSSALLRYDPRLVAVSVIVAVVLAFISLQARFGLRRRQMSETAATTVAATVMGIAVAGMHYTAMQASVFFPIAGIDPTENVLPTMLLALLIAVFSVLIAGLAIACFDRRPSVGTRVRAQGRSRAPPGIGTGSRRRPRAAPGDLRCSRRRNRDNRQARPDSAMEFRAPSAFSVTRPRKSREPISRC